LTLPSRTDSFHVPPFYPIVDTLALARRNWSPIAFSEALLRAGVKIFQYRHKEVWTQTQFDEAEVLIRRALDLTLNDVAGELAA